VAHNIGEDPELVTPTLKIKRGMVEKKFADIIEKMYQ
jgi:long-subunit acyl-CoA synthetase (AMP-forming)